MYCEQKNINPGKWNDTWGYYSDFHTTSIDRNDALLVQIVEQLGEEADGDCAKLAIVEIPDGVNWEIHEYDGSESIHEVHRSWS